MSEVKVNKISPRTACGTVTLGDSGDTFTIPSGATITNAGTASGFGATGAVNWDTASIKTATFTAVSGNGYFCNTAGGTFEMDLPAGSAGDIVSVQDYNNTFDTYALTIDPNGSEKMNGGAAGASIGLGTQGQGVTFVYIDSTVGWRSVQENTYDAIGSNFISATVSGACNTLETAPDCADTKLATFTGPGTFCVSLSGTPTNSVVSYAVVAGGGSGSPGNHGGGGGAGGFREYKSPVTPYTASPLDGNPGGTALTVSVAPYPITVGAGGTAPSCPAAPGTKGSDAIFSTITSAGGGAASRGPTPSDKDGGSGGGMASTCGTSYAGSGNTPPTTPAQGSDGGGIPGGASGPAYGAGGGGGATAVGGTGTPSAAGAGGAGVTTEISASPTAYAGGGGGSQFAPTGGAGGSGGTGGGGAGGRRCGSNAVSGTPNTGGGGGGGERSTPSTLGGNGGSGIIYIRYKFQ